MSEQTYWNGEPCKARRVRVRLPETDTSEFASPWYRDLLGQVVPAVEVRYRGAAFFLYDENGSAWAKVTNGRGSPRFGHRSLPVACEIVE